MNIKKQLGFLAIPLFLGISTTVLILTKESNNNLTTVQHSTNSLTTTLTSITSQSSTLVSSSLFETTLLVDTTQLHNTEVAISQSQSTLTQETVTRTPLAGAVYLLPVKTQRQRAWNTCAPTAVSMMLALRGIHISQEQLAIEMETDEDFGTHNVNAIKILNRHLFGYDAPKANQSGYRIETVTTDDPNSNQMRLFKERFKQNIADGYPTYLTFDNARIYKSGAGEHNVAAVGYELNEDGTDIAYIYYADPNYTDVKKMTVQQLFYAMLSCVEPNYAW